MSRRSVTRAISAPLAIALVTTAIPTAIQNSAAINHWAGKTWATTLVYTDAGMIRLGQEFNKHAERGAEKVAGMREELGLQLSAAADAVTASIDATYTRTADTISSGAEATFASIDSLMTSVSQSVIAMLPRSDEQVVATVRPVDVKLPAREEVQHTVSLPVTDAASPVSLLIPVGVGPAVSAMATDVAPAPSMIAAIEPPAPPAVYREPVAEPQPESEKTFAPAPVEKIVVAALEPARTVTPAPAPVVSPEVTIEAAAESAPLAEPVPAAKPALEMSKDAEPAPVLEVKAPAEEKPAVTVEAKIAIEAPIPTTESKVQEPPLEEKLVVASLSHHGATADVPAIADPAPAIAFETREKPTDKADEKLVVASLGPQNTAVDASGPEFKALPVSEPVASNSHVIDPLQMTSLPMSSPLKIRALTRADIPTADKLASLAPSSADSALPAEQQRVAYDAPIPLDEPMSIGRRRWTEEAAKYQGLGSPEALLEALKHMGAGAKSLGLPASLWCADFMNLVLRKSGIPATGSRAARSYLQYGQKISEPRVGAIAIFSRGGPNSGHVGIVRGTDGNGNPIIISGNHNHKVAEAVYPKSRVIAYVVPR